jgi:hypothetical protein
MVPSAGDWPVSARRFLKYAFLNTYNLLLFNAVLRLFQKQHLFGFFHTFCEKSQKDELQGNEPKCKTFLAQSYIYSGVVSGLPQGPPSL